ncbi:hypothetical protein POM88_002274 [Heracleum sosnowskyi]|uniref:UEV domain-containing protein n=1 Tax=Heracleum sosnowskyi TaxID=360622 RepID=A0AAD8JEF2_9APIA|nr:hypothetical protein POM88_002274 [Heracleum sosnowskyi]
MSSSSSVHFIDSALSCTSPFALSYTDPDKKWLIRKHLILLLQNFPSFRPSVDVFTHNDGNIVNLLFATGELHVSNSASPINLSIWLHENYPDMAPIVFVSSNLGKFSTIPPIHLIVLKLFKLLVVIYRDVSDMNQ